MPPFRVRRHLIFLTLFLISVNLLRGGFDFSLPTNPPYANWWPVPKTDNYNASTLNDNDFSTLLDKQNFTFLITPQQCEDTDNIFLLIFIHSKPSHIEERKAIRQTWGSKSNFRPNHLRIIFLVGTSKYDKIISQENLTYADIIQGNFVDGYRQLTYKHVMGLKWVSYFCRQAKYIMKCDDNIFIDIFQLVHYIKGTFGSDPDPDLLFCIAHQKSFVKRNSYSRWFVSFSDYTDVYYASYCSGWGLLMSPDVVYRLYSTAQERTLRFWVDDVYISGLLAQNAGILLKEISDKSPIARSLVTYWMHDDDPKIPILMGLSNVRPNMALVLWSKTLTFY